MSDRLTQVDLDLQEIEAALHLARKSGGDFHAKAAADAWCRLKEACGSTLPKSYRPMFLRNGE